MSHQLKLFIEDSPRFPLQLLTVTLQIAAALAKENIFVWSGHSYALEVVKSLTLLDSGGVVRVGPVHYNGIEEIDDFIEVLGRIITHQN